MTTEPVSEPADDDSIGGVPARPRRRWVTTLRVVVTLGILAFLVTKFNVRDLLPKHFGARTVVYLVLALVFAFIGIVLSAWRWQRVLVVYGADVPLKTVVAISLAGLFVGSVLPSTIGGDVVRVKRMSNLTGSTQTSFGSVVVERLAGWVVLPFIVFVGFINDHELIEKPHAWIALVTAGAAFALLIVVLVLAAHPRLGGRYESNDNWTRFIGAIHRGVNNMRHQPRAAVMVVLAAALYQVTAVIVVDCIIQALGLQVSIAAVIAFVPAIAMLQVLPISLGGFGVREGAFVLLFHPLGVPTGSAIAVGLLWYATNLAVGLLGAPAFAIGQRHKVMQSP